LDKNQTKSVNKDRLGTVLSVNSQGTIYKVLWDGTKSPQAYHISFIEKVENDKIS